MRHSWQIWLVIALMALSLLYSVFGVIHPDQLEVQVFDWWGRGSWVPLLNGLSSLSIVLALLAVFLHKPWSLALVLSGIWIPKVLNGIYIGIVLNNLNDVETMVPKPALNPGEVGAMQTHVQQLFYTWGFSAILALLFAWGTAFTVLVWWKRAEIQGQG